MGTSRVVVCLDGSIPSVAALRWAAGEARRLRVGLLVANFAGRTRFAFSRGTGDDSFSVDDLTTCDLVEGVPTEMTTIAGRAAPRLLEVSSDAEMLVIAGSGGALADYVSRRIAVRAGIPVVVVRGQSLCGRRPIAVGVTDRSADHVLGTAFSAAADRGCGLLAARAYISAIPFRSSVADGEEADTSETEAEERARLSRVLAPWQERYPGVPVELELAHTSAAAALVAASHRAQLVVVGRHGRSMLAAGLSGSPVAQLLRRAACPVFLARQ